MTQPKLKEILDCWEHCAHKVDMTQLVQALNEAIDVMENISQGGTPECCCAFHPDEWLKKWMGEE